MPHDQATALGDRYLLGEVIGRGGMADVYRATDQLLHRDVAVKVLRETTENDTDRQRFTSEATTLARLSHPGLVTVLDAGITAEAERPYLVMELVDGPSLSQACQDGPLETDRVASIGAQVADALAFAHDQQIVHRDVKPGNVLLGTDGRVRLADFGIARLIGDTVRHTRTGHAIGTPAYLAPEQVRGDEVTTAVDVYSLGLVLLEALTGERAFPGTPTESAVARLSRSPEVPDSLPDRWRTLLRAMTALEPGDRPTAAQVASTLQDAEDPTATRVLPQAPPPAAGTPPTPPSPAAPAAPARPAGPSFADRAGDAIARQTRDLARRAAELPHHLRVVAAVVAAILVLIVIAAIAGNSGGSDPSEVPRDTPEELQQPLQQLHDAVEGEG